MTTLKAETLRALAEKAGSGVLHDRIHDEARERHLNDATMSGYEHHIVLVAAEHGARLALLEADKDERVAALEAENARMREALERCRTIVQQHNHRQNEKVEDVVHIVNRALGEPQA